MSNLKRLLLDIAESNDDFGIYIFGTSSGGKALLKFLQGECTNYGIRYTVKGFFDNDRSKQGVELDGVMVTYPHVEQMSENDYVFIASLSYTHEMEAQLLEIGVEESKIVPPGDYLEELLIATKWVQPLLENTTTSEKKHFKNMLEKLDMYSGIYIFGTGKGGQLLLKHLWEVALNTSTCYTVKGFFDNQVSKQGSFYEGIHIMKPQKEVIGERDAILIASGVYYDDMQGQLLDMGVAEEQIILPDKWLDEVLDNRENDTDLLYMNGKKLQLKLYDSLDTLNQCIVFNKVDHPLVSIIIPVHNQWQYTKACLLSIWENTQDILYEVIVADDLSTDETVQIDQYIKNIRVIRNQSNLGFLQNCNNAAQHARGKYIVFLNNDTNVQIDWLKYIVELIQRDDKTGMVGAKLIYADGRLQEAGGIIWSDASGWNYGRLDDPEKPEYNYVKEVDYISGAAIMIRVDLWRAIGGFDERFAPAYFEDADLAFEVRRRGYKVLYQPKSVVVHFEGISHGTNILAGIKRYQAINKVKFVDKWENALETEQYSSGDNVFWARDRSGGKKTILVIDHHVPYYDYDAGGRTTYHYLKLFLELGLHVIFLGDHYKREPYTTELEQMGIEVLYGPWYKEKFTQWVKEHGRYLDYAYLNRPNVADRYIDDIKALSKAKVIYYGHDLHYLREYRQYELEKKPELLEAACQSKKLEFELFNKADVIHVVSSYEHDILKREIPHKPIRHIPGYIFCDSEQDTGAQVKCFEETKDIMFVGGFNHKPNVDAMLWFVHSIFPRIIKLVPDIKLNIIGSNPPYFIRKMKSENVIVTGYISDDELARYYQKIRLIVAPLRYGAGVKGKIVEAIFNMTPVVTTSIGAEGVPGLEDEVAIANDEEGFTMEVVKLYHNKDLWLRKTKSALSFLGKNFSKKKAMEILLLDISR